MDNKYLIVMVPSGNIKRTYVEFIRMYLQARGSVSPRTPFVGTVKAVLMYMVGRLEKCMHLGSYTFVENAVKTTRKNEKK